MTVKQPLAPAGYCHRDNNLCGQLPSPVSPVLIIFFLVAHNNTSYVWCHHFKRRWRNPHVYNEPCSLHRRIANFFRGLTCIIIKLPYLTINNNQTDRRLPGRRSSAGMPRGHFKVVKELIQASHFLISSCIFHRKVKTHFGILLVWKETKWSRNKLMKKLIISISSLRHSTKCWSHLMILVWKEEGERHFWGK